MNSSNRGNFSHIRSFVFDKNQSFLQTSYGILIEFYCQIYRTADFNNARFVFSGAWIICPNPRNYERCIAGIRYVYIRSSWNSGLSLRNPRFLSTPNFGAGAGSPKRSITIDRSAVGSSQGLPSPIREAEFIYNVFAFWILVV